MSFVPTFKLYASNGSTLVYTFEHVIETNWPYEVPSSIEYTNLRSSGSIIVPGGSKSYDLYLRGVLIANDYTALTTKIFALKDTIVANTRYVLKIDKSISTHDTINVMRLSPIEFDASDRRVKIQHYTLTLRALSWS